MVRKSGKLLAGFVIALFALTLCMSSTISAQAKKAEKKLTVHDIMEKVPGKKGLCATTVAAAKGEKWDDAAKLAKELKMYGDALPKADKPEKGTKESWDKLAKEFAVNMNTVATGVEKKDNKMVAEGATAFGKSCKACHDAHKE